MTTAQLALMSVDEKLDLLQDLWDDLRSNSGAIPSPSWHGAVLAQRSQDGQTLELSVAADRIRRQLRFGKD